MKRIILSAAAAPVVAVVWTAIEDWRIWRDAWRAQLRRPIPLRHPIQFD